MGCPRRRLRRRRHGALGAAERMCVPVRSRHRAARDSCARICTCRAGDEPPCQRIALATAATQAPSLLVPCHATGTSLTRSSPTPRLWPGSTLHPLVPASSQQRPSADCQTPGGTRTCARCQQRLGAFPTSHSRRAGRQSSSVSCRPSLGGRVAPKYRSFRLPGISDWALRPPSPSHRSLRSSRFVLKRPENFLGFGS